MADIYKDYYDYPISKDELHNCEIMTDRARMNYLLAKNYQMKTIELFGLI